MAKRVVFDIETESLSAAFFQAQADGDEEERLKALPRMRLACAYDGRKWHFFLPSEAADLIKLLATADEVISFNGLGFDEPVLRQHYGLTGPLPIAGKHLDLCKEIYSRHGVRANLNSLALLNLDERKHVEGRRMADLDIEALRDACRSDVSQTHRLWQLWTRGALKLPYWVINRSGGAEFDMVGPGHHMPLLCPHCHSANSLELIDDDIGEMSEGEAADYEAGMWGIAICTTCQQEVDWGF